MAKDDAKKKKSGGYGAEQISVLEGLEPVRKRPGMYIGSTGPDGLFHLLREVADNSFDEAMAGHADEIIITLLPDDRVSVYDNGRGIVDGTGYAAECAAAVKEQGGQHHYRQPKQRRRPDSIDAPDPERHGEGHEVHRRRLAQEHTRDDKATYREEDVDAAPKRRNRVDQICRPRPRRQELDVINQDHKHCDGPQHFDVQIFPVDSWSSRRDLL